MADELAGELRKAKGGLDITITTRTGLGRYSLLHVRADELGAADDPLALMHRAFEVALAKLLLDPAPDHQHAEVPMSKDDYAREGW